MQRLGHAEIQQWCHARDIRFSSTSTARPEPTVGTIEVQFETASLQKTLRLLECLAPDWVDCVFAGGLVVFDRRGHWGANDERIGRRVLDLLLSAGETTYEDGDGLIFEVGEHDDMQLATLTAVVAGWDAALILQDAQHVALLSHDGVATVHCRTQRTWAEMNRRFGSLDLPTVSGSNP